MLRGAAGKLPLNRLPPFDARVVDFDVIKRTNWFSIAVVGPKPSEL
jgi:hypothetical protein